MKKQIVYILFSCITLVSCSLYELDNQDPPKSEVYGNLVYNGQVVPVKNGQIPLNFIRIHIKEMEIFKSCLRKMEKSTHYYLMENIK